MPATFMQRLKAFLIDYLLILFYLALLFMFSLFLFPSIQGLFKGSLVVAQLTGFILLTFPISLYFIISDSKIGKQSFGKRRVGIKVVDKQGKSPSLLRMTFRTGLKFSPWELSHFLIYRLVDGGEFGFTYYLIAVLIYGLIFTYILTAIFTKEKKSLYDTLTNTQVINVSK